MPYHLTYLLPFSYYYRYPQEVNYMTYTKPTLILKDCQCDSSETYSECVLRKRMFHC